MKVKNPSTGNFEEVYVKALDSLPVGTEVDFTGSASDIPAGWEQIEEWKTLPLAEGITQYSSADHYKCQYKKVGNQVFIRGCIKGVSTGNVVIATLPTGYRPTSTARYVNGYNTSKGGTILSYETDGDLVFVGYTSGTTVADTDFIYIQTSFFVD